MLFSLPALRFAEHNACPEKPGEKLREAVGAAPSRRPGLRFSSMRLRRSWKRAARVRRRMQGKHAGRVADPADGVLPSYKFRRVNGYRDLQLLRLALQSTGPPGTAATVA